MLPGKLIYLCYGKFCTEKHTTNLYTVAWKIWEKEGKEIYQNLREENPPNFALDGFHSAEVFPT